MNMVFCADIIPLIRMPASKRTFSYRVPKDMDLCAGHVVRVIFRGKKIFGLVVSCSQIPLPPYRLSDVQELIHNTPLLSITDIKTIITLSKLYHVYAGVFAKMMLPPLQPRKIAALTLLPPVKPPAEVIPQKQLLLIRSQSELTKLFTLLAQYRNASCLIITPTQWDSDFFVQQLREQFPTQTIDQYGSTISAARRRSIWESHKSPKPQWCVSTRHGIFLPLEHVDVVLTWNPQDENHTHWDALPHYDTNTVLQLRQKAHTFTIIEITHTVTITHIHELQQQTIQRIDDPEPPARYAPNIIGMNDEIRKKNFSLLSEAAQEELTTATPQQKVLVLHNRKGFSHYIRCVECDFVFTCQTCAKPISITANGTMHCATLSHAVPQHQSCPKCSSMQFAFAAKGIEAVAFTLSKALPQHHIGVVKQETEHDVSFATASCIVATDVALRFLDRVDAKTILIPYADRLLHRPWYNATQEAMYFFDQVMWRKPADTICIAQTFTPEHKLWQAQATIEALRHWYASELATRKQHDLPPFTKLIRITVPFQKMITQKNIHGTVSRLREIFTGTEVKIQQELPDSTKNDTNELSFLITLQKKHWKQILSGVHRHFPDSWRVSLQPHAQ